MQSNRTKREIHAAKTEIQKDNFNEEVPPSPRNWKAESWRKNRRVGGLKDGLSIIENRDQLNTSKAFTNINY